MMLQNYTYVDPVMDPVVLLTLLLGLVFLTAAIVVYFTIRSLPMSAATSAEPVRGAPPAFVSPEADRIVLTPSVPARTRWPDADKASPQTNRRPNPRAERPPNRRNRTHTLKYASQDTVR